MAALDTTTPAAPPLSTPAQWRELLLGELAARQPYLQQMDDYYRGEHRLLFATARFRETFGSMFSAYADNWCDLVVDASAERLRVEGFRFGGDSGAPADAEAWTIWQRNGLVADSDLAHTEAIKLGCAYALVGPDDAGKALIQIEPPTTAIVAYDPGTSRRRLAGLRAYCDEWGVEHCVLYLPDSITWWRREDEKQGWRPDAGSGTNALGVVPLVPLANAPTLRERQGRSDVERVIPVQNAVNKLCCDMIVASEFAAFPQRWATGIEIPKDPDTNQPLTGRALAATGFLGGADRVWGVEEQTAKFGDFTVSDLGNYARAIEMLVQHIAAQTRTPPHYLLGASGNFPSGESLKATETGLVAKVRRKQLSLGEGWEEALRLAFTIEGPRSKADAVAAETIWANPESRSVAETTDAAVKMSSIGVPRPALWEFIGATPQQIEAWVKAGADITTGGPVTVRETVAATPQQAGVAVPGAPTTPAAPGPVSTSVRQPPPPPPARP
jgi:hypothetical protein